VVEPLIDTVEGIHLTDTPLRIGEETAFSTATATWFAIASGVPAPGVRFVIPAVVSVEGACGLPLDTIGVMTTVSQVAPASMSCTGA